MRTPLVLTLAALLTGCPTPPVVADAGPSDAGPADSGINPDAGATHPPLEAARSVTLGLFATGLVCNECHSATTNSTANRDEQNRPVGLYEQWSASAMGNSARDPLFRAALANERARAPAAADAISSVCLGCHSPMARVTQVRADGGATRLDDVYAASDEGALARDGVSCTLCHQVQAGNLGQESSYSGNFTIAPVREQYGPYAAPFAMPMQNRTGFTPTQGLHIQSSEMCGTCHALVTEAVTPAGGATGHLMGEQLTYLEWKRSDFGADAGTSQSCQSCHMPDLRDDGQPLLTRLAHRPSGDDFPPVGPRGPFSRHTFAGANTVLPKLLRAGRSQLNPTPSDAALEEAEQRARDVLRRDTARVTVTAVQRAGTALSFRVRVDNLVGHKLPSGYPSRRLFLHFRVVSAAGAPLFEVGAVDAQGRIVGADGAPLPEEVVGGGFHPHRVRVTSAAEPAVWESVMRNGNGGASYELLGTEGYAKDNRLLPRGHVDATSGPLSTAPIGVAGDQDFIAGSDGVEVVLPALSDVPTAIEVEVRYQTFSPRYLDEVLRRDTPEATALRGMLRPGTLAPELAATSTVVVP